MNAITVQPLTTDAFAPFGEVLSTTGEPDRWINQKQCGRYHDRATLDFVGGRAGVSLFHSQTYTLPYTLTLLERHPLGSQAFIPCDTAPFLIIAAEDEQGRPSAPRAFISDGEQGINFHRNVWHGVLTPLGGRGMFTVVDRIGEGDNLEEYVLDQPWRIDGAD